jgi:hypothetical protein
VRATNETGIFVGLDAAHNLVAGNGAISYSANGINDSGQVIIAADFGLYTYNPQRNHDAIFLGQAGVSGSALVAENTRLSAPGAFRTLSRRSAVINNAGQIAFTAQAWESTANGYGEGLYSGATSESAIITTAGRFFTFQSWIDMNDSGTLAFVASEDNAYVPGVYVGRGEDATLLASEGATFVEIKWVDINNHGSVDFNSQLGAAHGGFNGIFNGPSFQDRVIGPGDELFGSTVRDAFFRRGGFNDQGEVAFHYITTDNKWGVAVATPATFGDADLNRVVNFDDYAAIDNGFNNELAGWSNGDFDGNGVINFDDYALIDAAFNQQGGDGAGGGGRAGTGAVPEPGVAAFTFLPILAAARRRHRQRHRHRGQ